MCVSATEIAYLKAVRAWVRAETDTARGRARVGCRHHHAARLPRSAPLQAHPEAPPCNPASRTCVKLQLVERALAAQGARVAACGQGDDGEAVGARADLVVVLGDAPLAVLVVVVASAVGEGGDKGGHGGVRRVDLGRKCWHTARAHKRAG